MNNHPVKKKIDVDALNRVGLTQQAIFDLERLPKKLCRQLKEDCTENELEFESYSQVILIAHHGRQFWKSLRSESKKMGFFGDNPVDEFSVSSIKHSLDAQICRTDYSFLYPLLSSAKEFKGRFFENQSKEKTSKVGKIENDRTCQKFGHSDLQAFGKLAGWHHDSPFGVGINEEWGSWFAYRALILAKSCFEPTQRLRTEPPCISCISKPCMDACPAKAVTAEGLVLKQCIDYRTKENSFCQRGCLARVACPVGREFQYSHEQTNYHYLQSYQLIKSFTDK